MAFFTPPRTSEKKSEKPKEEIPKANIFATVKVSTDSPLKPNVFASASSSEKEAPANSNPFGSSTANVFGSSKPDATKSTFKFRNVVVSSSDEKATSDGESGHISETDSQSDDDLEETIKIATSESSVPKPNLFASAPKSGLFGSAATESNVSATKTNIFGTTTPKGPFGSLSKPDLGASGDKKI